MIPDESDLVLRARCSCRKLGLRTIEGLNTLDGAKAAVIAADARSRRDGAWLVRTHERLPDCAGRGWATRQWASVLGRDVHLEVAQWMRDTQPEGGVLHGVPVFGKRLQDGTYVSAEVTANSSAYDPAVVWVFGHGELTDVGAASVILTCDFDDTLIAVGLEVAALRSATIYRLFDQECARLGDLPGAAEVADLAHALIGSFA